MVLEEETRKGVGGGFMHFSEESDEKGKRRGRKGKESPAEDISVWDKFN